MRHPRSPGDGFMSVEFFIWAYRELCVSWTTCLGRKRWRQKKRTGRTGPGAQDHVEVDGYCFMWRIVPVGVAGRFRR
jgi:hypothetical protein